MLNALIILKLSFQKVE